MAKYIPNNVKQAVANVVNKKIKQCETNVMFSQCDYEGTRGIDYNSERELFGQILVQSLTPELRKQKLFKNKYGQDTMFYHPSFLTDQGKVIYKSLRKRGVASQTIQQWIYREGFKMGILIIFSQEDSKNGRGWAHIGEI